MPPPPDLPLEPVTWLDDGNPHSARFGDIYHSRAGRLQQSEQVFLGGAGLPARWRDTDAHQVLETGFGLGLNFLATWAAWEADAQRSASLHFTSVEAYPVAAADILRNVQDLPAVAALARTLAAAWQSLSAGVQTLRFANGRVELTLAIGPVQAMLAALHGAADTLYLDGFSPATNPELWSLPTLQAATRLCRPGARLATYSTAAEVRERLQHLGWQVERRKGLPPKRRRLEGILAP